MVISAVRQLKARVASDGNLSSFKAGEPPQGQCARSWKDFPPHDLAHDPAEEVLSLEKVTRESMDCATIPLFLAGEIVRYRGVIEGDVTLYRRPSRLRQNVRARAMLVRKGNGWCNQRGSIPLFLTMHYSSSAIQWPSMSLSHALVCISMIIISFVGHRQAHMQALPSFPGRGIGSSISAADVESLPATVAGNPCKSRLHPLSAWGRKERLGKTQRLILNRVMSVGSGVFSSDGGVDEQDRSWLANFRQSMFKKPARLIESMFLFLLV